MPPGPAPQQDALDEDLEHLAVRRALDGHHGADTGVERADYRGDGAGVSRHGPTAGRSRSKLRDPVNWLAL
jgi:hypothetical protein